MLTFYARCLYETCFAYLNYSVRNVNADRFNFRYSAFHTVCRLDLVEFASPTAGFEGTCGLILQLLNGSDTCCSVSVSTHLVSKCLQKMYGINFPSFGNIRTEH
jgi:hypothetical protein